MGGSVGPGSAFQIGLSFFFLICDGHVGGLKWYWMVVDLQCGWLVGCWHVFQGRHVDTETCLGGISHG